MARKLFIQQRGYKLMKFTLEIDLDNAAFSVDDDAARAHGWRDGRALVWQLRLIAEKIKAQCDLLSSDDRGLVRDLNGNTCGHWAITEEE